MRHGASPHWTVFVRLGNTALMSEKNKISPKGITTREDRLKAALKANMAKRKAQARARDAAAGKEKKE